MKTEDLLELLSFIKVDEKYMARLKELQVAEEGLKEKLSIASTVDQALRLKRDAEDELLRLDARSDALDAAHAERTAELEGRHKAKMDSLAEKETTLNVLKNNNVKMLEESKGALAAAELYQAESKKLRGEANEKLAAARTLEAKLAFKLSKLKAVIEEE